MPKTTLHSADCAVTLVSGTCILVSVQHTQQQQRQVLQQDQHLNGQTVVKCVIDTIGGLKQTPLEGTENTWNVMQFHLKN